MATLDPTSVKRRSPLNQRHVTSHALFKEFGGNLLVGHYGDIKSIQRRVFTGSDVGHL